MWWYAMGFFVASTLLHGVVLTALWQQSSEVAVLKAQVQLLKRKNRRCAVSCFSSRLESDAKEKRKRHLDSDWTRFKDTDFNDDHWRLHFPLRTQSSLSGDFDWDKKHASRLRYLDDDWPDDELYGRAWNRNPRGWRSQLVRPYSLPLDVLPSSVARKQEEAHRRACREERKRRLRLFEKSYKSVLLQGESGDDNIDAPADVTPLASNTLCSTAPLTRFGTPTYNVAGHPEIASSNRSRTQTWTSKFPRIIHQTWATQDIPSKMAGYVKSWMRLGWRYEFWDEKRLDDMFSRRFPEHAQKYAKFSGVKRADVARLAILYFYGGVYADLDTEVVGNIDQLLASASTFDADVIMGSENILHSRLLEKRDDGILSNAVIIAQPGAAFLLQLLNSIFRGIEICGDDPVECTGPRAMDMEARHYNQSRLLILPYSYFSPKIARWNAGTLVSLCRFPRTSAVRACRVLREVLETETLLFSWRTLVVHHWQCSWCRKDDELRKTVPLRQLQQLSNLTPYS